MDQDLGVNEPPATDYIALTADIVAAYVSNNSVRAGDMAELLASVHAAVARLSQSSTPEAPTVDKLTASQIRKSITHDALISFIDGKAYKTLKRHLGKNGLTIEQYRERYGLPRDYPSTAPSYSEQRSALAKSLGLGSLRKKPAPQVAEAPEIASEMPKRVGRPRKGTEA